ncbi:serine/threonine-protein phosphatase [Tanacetum coccineum]|uniref:Serine/threonine-protein phosphatase n=1 Tax=Tanacetum coccineum TaxID=301880 RepID=A0ABQ5J1M6_9ASTR
MHQEQTSAFKSPRSALHKMGKDIKKKGKSCEKKYSSMRRYVADPVNVFPEWLITKLILKEAVIFDVITQVYGFDDECLRKNMASIFEVDDCQGHTFIQFEPTSRRGEPDLMRRTPFIENKQLRVFGGNGFVGSHICKEALDRGFSVAILSRWNPSNLDAMGESFLNELRIVEDMKRKCDHKSSKLIYYFPLLLQTFYMRTSDGDCGAIALQTRFETTKGKMLRTILFSTESTFYMRTPDGDCRAIALQTRFETTKGKLLRTIVFSTESFEPAPRSGEPDLTRRTPFSRFTLHSSLYQLIISTWNPSNLDAMGESLLNELRIVEDMKRRSDHKSSKLIYYFPLLLQTKSMDLMMNVSRIENKQLLVLGGYGFVGSHICKEALDHGFSVASLSSFLYQLIILTWNPSNLDAIGESLLNELRIVEDMKRQCDHKSSKLIYYFPLLLQTFYMITPDGDCGAIALQTRFETTKGKLLRTILFSTESVIEADIVQMLWQNTFYMRTPDGDCGAIALQTRFETTKGKLLRTILFSTESVIEEDIIQTLWQNVL